MTPSNPNHHQHTISLVTGVAPYRHCIEAQTRWGIKKFVHTPGCLRVVDIEADNQTRTAAPATPRPHQPLNNTRGDSAH